MLNLQLLHSFVTVAETENVGRAAEILHVSQSPLSRQIMQLEAQLGLELFERARQRLRLTPDGADFLIAARDLLARAEELESYGHRLGEGRMGRLHIGYVEGAVHAGAVSHILKRFREDRPDVQLHLISQRSHAQVEALRQRTLDFGFVYNPPPPDDPEIESRLLFREPLLLAVPAGDPLLELAKITPAALDGRRWITVVRQPVDTNRDGFLAACREAGFSPDIAHETADPLTSLGLVSAGLGLATVQASLAASGPADVVFREIPWFERWVAVSLAWRRNDRRPALAALLGAVFAMTQQADRASYSR